MRRFLLLVAAVVVCLPTSSNAQTRSLSFPVPGKYLISLPETITSPAITDMAQLCTALQSGPGCNLVARHDPMTDEFLVWNGASCNRCSTFPALGCVNPDPGIGCGCFCIDPTDGRGYTVDVGAGSLVLTASDGPQNTVLLGDGPNSLSGMNYISIPYDTNLLTAKALFQSVGSNALLVKKYLTSSDAFAVYAHGTNDFQLNCGEGYVVRLKPGAVMNYSPPTTGQVEDPCSAPPTDPDPPVSCEGDFIDFDDIDATAGPVEVGNFYQSAGIQFEDLFVYDVSSNPFYTSGPGVPFITLPNGGQVNDEAPYSLTVTARIVTSAGSPSTTDLFEFQASDAEAGTTLVDVTAYDLGGNQIFFQSFPTPASRGATIVINVPGIHRVVIQTDVDGAIVDNFCFEKLAAVPALDPRGLWTLGLALALVIAVAVIRRFANEMT